MRILNPLAACAVALFLVGCAASKTAVVGMRTDANGRHVRTYIVHSSGHDASDKTALASANKYFRKQVRSPRANHTYHMEVKVRIVEPMWSDKPLTKNPRP